MEAIVLCMGTGNWTGAEDRYRITDDFPLTCGDAKYFGPHEYSWPTLQAGAGWYALRFRAWIEDLKAAGRDDFHFIISEAGITQAIIPDRDDVGWRSGGPEGVTEDSYISTIAWYNARLCEDWRVLGCCLYDWAGSHYGWPTFEQLGLENRIFQIQAPEAPEPPAPPEPPEPPQEDPMDIAIYDFDNDPFDPNATIRDWPWLRSIFGPDLRVHPIEEKADVDLQPGDIIYKVQWLDCKVGVAGIGIHVEGIDGNPEEGKLPVFGWPSAEPHGLPQTWALWTEDGVHGPTNDNGDVGPGMGTGAYYDWSKIDPETGKLECGPHFVWVWDLPSDQVTGIGMLTWHPDVQGNHLHVNVGYRAEVYQEEPPVDGELLVVANKIYGEAKETRLLVAEIRNWLRGQEPPGPPEPEVFHAEYFPNMELEGEPALTRDEEKIDHFWGEGSPGPPIPADYFSARWKGQVTFKAGEHNFHALVDDGFRLWVGGALIIEAWKPQSPTRYNATVTLPAGEHEIVAEFYEAAGGATCKVWWES